MLKQLFLYIILSFYPKNTRCSDSDSTSSTSSDSDSDSDSDDESYWIYSFVTLTAAFVILIIFLLYRACHNCIEDERSSMRNRFRGSKGFDQASFPGNAAGGYYQQQNEKYPAEYGNYTGNPQVNPLERPYLDQNKYPGSNKDIYQGSRTNV